MENSIPTQQDPCLYMKSIYLVRACQCTLLWASLFNETSIQLCELCKIATVSLGKQCKSIKGTADRTKLRIIEQHKCDERTINSKAGYSAGSKPSEPLGSASDSQVPPRVEVLPVAVMPSSYDDVHVVLCCGTSDARLTVDSAS